jgi:hypothetical protein
VIRAALVLLAGCGRIAFDPLAESRDGAVGGDDAPASDVAGAQIPVNTQGAYATSTVAVTGLVKALPATVLSTDVILLAIGWNDAVSVVNSVSDTSGDAFGPVTAVQRGGAESQVIYLATAPAGGTETINVVFSQSVPNVSVRIAVYARAQQTTALATSSSSGTSTFATSGVLTTDIDNSLVVAAVAGTINGSPDLAFLTVINTNPLGHLLEQRVAATVGPYQSSASFGAAADWVIQMVALRPL